MTRPQKIRPLRQLGRGAVGVVYAAYHRGLQREVAVKRIPKSMVACQPKQLERLRREAVAASQLRSPHAVRILEHRRDRRAAYIVMELLRGASLQQVLTRYGKIAAHHVASILSQVGEVLTEAHALGMVHRDIKPANLFLVRDRELPFVKVLDFGIAKWLDEAGDALTGTNEIIGTPAFMSPEQLRGNTDAHVDMWALAVVAYRALTGKLPFQGDFVTVAMSVLTSDFAPPSRLCGDCGPHVDAWFRRAFAPRREDRFRDVQELCTSFRRLWLRRDQLPTIVYVDVDWEEPTTTSTMRYAG